MPTKFQELSTSAKFAIGAGLAALLAVGVGVAVWQPWNQAEDPPREPDAVQQEPAAPQEPVEEQRLSVKAGGEDVPCTLYQGDGWSILAPDGWKSEGTGTGAAFTSEDGAEMTVDFRDPDRGAQRFFILSEPENGVRQLQFCGGEGGAMVTCRALESKWNRYEKLFTALVKTLTVGTQEPFAGSYALPQEPDWQVAEGMTILFSDKDGVVLDGMVEKAVEEYMLSWPTEDRAIYTGQYRINGVDWVASFTGLSDPYIDVFRARVQYRVAADGEEAVKAREGVTVADGWATLPDRVHLVFTGDATNPRTVIAPEQEDWAEFVNLIQ